jgi:hypothetical protein
VELGELKTSFVSSFHEFHIIICFKCYTHQLATNSDNRNQFKHTAFQDIKLQSMCGIKGQLSDLVSHIEHIIMLFKPCTILEKQRYGKKSPCGGNGW